MLTIGWFEIPLPPELSFLSAPFFSFLATALAWTLVALLVDLILNRFLRWVIRNIPGEIEDIVLGLVRKPILILLVVFGAVQPLELLGLPDNVIDFIQMVANTIIVLVIVYLSWRVIKDVILFYGKRWARRTASRLHDVIWSAVVLRRSAPSSTRRLKRPWRTRDCLRSWLHGQNTEG